MASCDGVSWTVRSRAATTQSLNDIWTASPAEAFAVGDDGAILHYAGGSWLAMTTPLSASPTLNGAWGFSPSDVFAVGEGAILHYDGISWTGAPGALPGLGRVWGTSASDVFAVGDASGGGPAILHYDGATWSSMTVHGNDGLADVWGSSASDVYAVGGDWNSGNAEIQHYDGALWSLATACPTSQYYFAIWGLSASDVYVTANNNENDGIICRYDGTAWSVFWTYTDPWISRIWGTSNSDIYVTSGSGVLHYDGANWAVSLPDVNDGGFGSVRGSGPDDVYAVGANGAILHYAGSSPSRSKRRRAAPHTR